MLRFSITSMPWSFMVLFTALRLSHSEIEKDDVVMAFTFAQGDSKIGDVATILKDVSGNGHDGQIWQSARWLEGVWGAGLEVRKKNGSWCAATIPHTVDMDLQEFAIGAWVKTEKLIGDCCNMIVSKENWFPDRTRNYSMWMRDEVTVGFTTNNPFKDVQVRGIQITDGKWHHAVGTYDGRELIQYVDGVAHGKRLFGEQTPAFHSSEQLAIGAMGPGGGASGMEGVVDEVVIFNRGLTEEEVNSLMEQGLEKLLGFQAVNPQGKMATTLARIKSAEN